MNSKCYFVDKCNHKDCDTFCLKFYKCNYYFELGLIPESKRYIFPLHIDADGRDEQAFTRLSSISKGIEKFVEDGNNLYIYSSIVGSGKTSWAFRLLHSYIDKV